MPHATDAVDDFVISIGIVKDGIDFETNDVLVR